MLNDETVTAFDEYERNEKETGVATSSEKGSASIQEIVQIKKQTTSMIRELLSV
jgi:hypothetical protein